MSCKQIRDANGTSYLIKPEPTTRNVSGRVNVGTPKVEVWWSRQKDNKADEQLVIKQDNEDDRADVVMLSFAQTYDLIDALNKAVEKP